MNNSEYIGTEDFLSLLDSGNLSLYMQKLVMLRFPLLEFFDIRPTQNGNKFDVVINEPDVNSELLRNELSQGSEASDYPSLRFGEETWGVQETTEFKESFAYTTLIRNTQPDRVKKMASKAANVIGDALNTETTNILFNSAGIQDQDMAWGSNPSEAMNDVVNAVDDLGYGFIPDTMFVRSDKYNYFSNWLSNAGKGIAYVNPADRTETRVSSYIGISETDLAISNVYKLPATSKGIPDDVDYVAIDSRANTGYIYNALKNYEVPQELASYSPGFYNIDASNQFVVAFESLMNTNPSQYRQFLLASAKLGILEPNSIVSGKIDTTASVIKKAAKK